MAICRGLSQKFRAQDIGADRVGQVTKVEIETISKPTFNNVEENYLGAFVEKHLRFSQKTGGPVKC